MDLTKIDQPFGTLDIETKLALHRAHYEGATIEFRYPEDTNFKQAKIPSWSHATIIYRVAPEPQRDIQVPWHVFGPEVQWAARDEDGEISVYTDKPSIYGGRSFWAAPFGDYVKVDLIRNVDPGNKPWDQSLVRRPEGV